MRSGTFRSGTWRLGALGMALLLTASVPAEAPVADAAMRRDAEGVRLLLRQGADVNAAQGDGMTALHWAARNGDARLADMLLYAGAYLEATTRIGGYTPLLVAARSGNEAVLLQFVEAGANVQARSSTGVTVLHFAAGAGLAAGVQALVDRGADVNAREFASGQTPLMFAAAGGRTDALRVLLGAGAEVDVATEVVDLAAVEAADREDQRKREERVAAERGERVATPPPANQNAVLEEPPARPAGEEEARAPGEGAAAGASEPAAAEAVPAPPAGSEPPAESFEPQPGGGNRPQGGTPAGAEEERPLSYAELVGGHGGMTALLHAARQGHRDAVMALLDAGADIDGVTGGDGASPMLVATINGHWDLALELMARGADINLASHAGTTPLYAALNLQWAPKALYPQPRAHDVQRVGYLEFMEALLQAGADPNRRLERHLWYMSYNFDLLGVDTGGATPFWRAAYALDIPAMRLLLAHGADPGIPTRKPPERRRRGDAPEDPSGLEPIPVGGPGVYPIHAASGVGYGKDFAANSHRYVPGGWVSAVRFLVEELGADVNLPDHEGYTPLHHAASRGDVPLIEYLVERGADVMAVSRRGQSTADMANGAVQRVEPFPEALAFLESLGAINNNNCLSCE